MLRVCVCAIFAVGWGQCGLFDGLCCGVWLRFRVCVCRGDSRVAG